MKIKKYSFLGVCVVLIAIFAVFGCGKNTDKDTLKVGAMSYAGTLEPTENYFSWGL